MENEAQATVREHGDWKTGDIVRWSNANGWFDACLFDQIHPRQGERPAKWTAYVTAAGTYYAHRPDIVSTAMRLSEADFTHAPTGGHR